jgi:hypothetical protein
VRAMLRQKRRSARATPRQRALSRNPTAFRPN